MSRVRVQIMNQFHRKSHEYKAIKRYWKLIQQDSRKLSDKRFYRPTSNNLIKLIKRNAFGFRNFENFKKRIFIALNIKKERTKFVLSQA
ncbi:transposase [Streptococcus pneumoniae]|nr:transposase [Streptococcus pneumoniae]